MAAKIYAIARWRDVFETTKSRNYQSLTWISCPINFNSTGYQHLLEAFEDADNEFLAAAVYGAWQALCQLAAAHPDKRLRGVLCGERGEPYSIKRIARLTGLPAAVFEELFVWAVGEGWLVEYDPTADVDTDEAVPDFAPVPAESLTGTQQGPTEPLPGPLHNPVITRSEHEHIPTPSEPGPGADDRRPYRRGDGEGSDLFWRRLQREPERLQRAVRQREAAFFELAWQEASQAGWVTLSDRETRRRFLAACYYACRPPDGFAVANAAALVRHKLIEADWKTGRMDGADDDWARAVERLLDGTADEPRTARLDAPPPRSAVDEIAKLRALAAR